MINVELYLNFVLKTKITQSQFLFLYLIYYRSIDKKKVTTLVEKYREAYPSEDGTLIGRAMLNDLVQRKFIIKIKDDGKMSDYKLTDKFLKHFVDKYTAGNEIWDLYPTSLVTATKNYPLTAMDKNLFRELYWTAIKGSVEEHEQVKQDLVWAKENNRIDMKIENFVRSEHWTRLRDERLGINQVIGKPNVIYNENDF